MRGKSVGTMQHNVVIGRNAGRNMEDGANYNVIIGAAAGLTLTSGEKNIIIGYNTDVPTSTTSNYLNIGNVIKSQMDTGIVEMQKLKLTALPTSDPGVSGLLWNDNGVLKISQ